ncbi:MULTISPECIES: 60S ribosomal export protein NMD3 [unclassified Methanobrevibacter]|jgi:nonsense-mediated mRNA decay protein 3|uniref:60S ribosomal export protein NMD3 n=1 Tax=unclassified Methanobrevibacter TaxID=2638681 RepID=UPI0039B8F262
MFCPECGNTEEPLINGVCKNCFLKTYQMIKIPENIDVIICKHCNAKLFQGQWIDEEIPEEEIIYRAIEDAIKIDELTENPIIDLEILQMRGTIAECEVIVNGNVLNTDINEIYNVNVKLNHNVCPNCSKKESGYYEAVIQLRADNREIKQEELNKIEGVVQHTINKQAKKDKLAYIPQILTPKEGFDYYIGSYKTAKKIINNLKNEIGGESKESPRLISEDKSTGKGLYRIWISFRLPEYEIGDFVKFEDKILEITHISGHNIHCENLQDRKDFNIQWKNSTKVKLLEKNTKVKQSIVTDKSPSMIQILDPDDYTTVDLEMNDKFNNINIGQEVDTIKLEGQVYLL